MHRVKPITEEHSPTARPAELHNVKLAKDLIRYFYDNLEQWKNF